MKMATIPPIPIAPAFLEEIEQVPYEGEGMEGLAETAVCYEIKLRQTQCEFARPAVAASDGLPLAAVIAKLAEARNA